MTPILVALNQRQHDAVVADPTGALVILAGPGSGKTRTLCHRVAYLVQHYHVSPERIALVTFTNKAANEMKERIVRLLGASSAKKIVMGTFHSVCALLLRRHGGHVGLDRDFQIIDSDDSKAMVRDILKQHEDPEIQKYEPGKMLGEISHCKNKKITPNDVQAGRMPSINPLVSKELLFFCYSTYESELRRLKYLDFDDLLVYGARVCAKIPDISLQFQHVLVDEFQDTNELQYEITKHLARAHGCLTVVGDPDQAIYGWRFADVNNLTKNINNDFKDRIRMVHLNVGYRSTANIVNLCSEIISQDTDRHIDPITTTNVRGLPVAVLRLKSSIQESVMVAMEIRRLMAATSPILVYSDFSVLVRTQAMTLAFENAMNKFLIPYKIVGGTRFFDRQEIKDVLAYVRLAENFADQISFGRIINIPSRGLGEVTVNIINLASASMHLSCMEYCRRVCIRDIINTNIKGAATTNLRAFVDIIESLHYLIVQKTPVRQVLDAALKRSNYKGYLENKHQKAPKEFENRWANVEELLAFASQFDTDTSDSDGADEASRTPMQRFLDTSAMGTDHRDQLAESGQMPIHQVVISTLHSAKGLEWPCVFVVGVEDSVLPHFNAKDKEQHKEERRLLYVGMSRAQYFLYLSVCDNRWIHGRQTPMTPSPFLKPILSTLNINANVDEDDGDYFDAYDDFDYSGLELPRVGNVKPTPTHDYAAIAGVPAMSTEHAQQLGRLLGRSRSDASPDAPAAVGNIYFNPPDASVWFNEALLINQWRKDASNAPSNNNSEGAGQQQLTRTASMSMVESTKTPIPTGRGNSMPAAMLGGFTSASRVLEAQKTQAPPPELYRHSRMGHLKTASSKVAIESTGINSVRSNSTGSNFMQQPTKTKRARKEVQS